MTDANPYRNAAQDPDFLARNAKGQQQASPEAIAQWYERNAAMAPPYMKPNGQVDRARINAALAAYEEARMGARPKPKFILHIDGNHFHANRRRLPAGLLDMVMVAIGGAMWFAILAGLYLVFK
jgi:hypothetical protein